MNKLYLLIFFLFIISCTSDENENENPHQNLSVVSYNTNFTITKNSNSSDIRFILIGNKTTSMNDTLVDQNCSNSIELNNFQKTFSNEYDAFNAFFINQYGTFDLDLKITKSFNDGSSSSVVNSHYEYGDSFFNTSYIQTDGGLIIASQDNNVNFSYNDEIDMIYSPSQISQELELQSYGRLYMNTLDYKTYQYKITVHPNPVTNTTPEGTLKIYQSLWHYESIQIGNSNEDEIYTGNVIINPDDYLWWMSFFFVRDNTDDTNSERIISDIEYGDIDGGNGNPLTRKSFNYNFEFD